ncbi:hypothetical protein Trco_001058 [Trichoderma cornu-damae]|uniref:Uncharacterized protein n=1 Tax=Trichoderma cornu-damae TaxID=654480 RepID=A0A9P8QYD6_9HYPO|nr:hypothetical protein Trco_001058 [Trichoderma cornu-damae]
MYDATVFIVGLAVAYQQVKVFAKVAQAVVLFLLDACLDVIHADGVLDNHIIVGILAFGRQLDKRPNDEALPGIRLVVLRRRLNVVHFQVHQAVVQRPQAPLEHLSLLRRQPGFVVGGGFARPALGAAPLLGGGLVIALFCFPLLILAPGLAASLLGRLDFLRAGPAGRRRVVYRVRQSHLLELVGLPLVLASLLACRRRLWAVLVVVHGHEPLLFRQTIVVLHLGAFASATAEDHLFGIVRDGVAFVEIDIGQLILAHQSSLSLWTTVYRVLLPVLVQLLEDEELVVVTGKQHVQLFVFHLLLLARLGHVGGFQQGAKHGVAIGLGGFVVEATCLDDLAVHVQLEPSAFQNLFLDGVGADETQNSHLVLLTDTVGAVLGLQILVRIPVRVVNDDGIGSLQVEAQTAGTSRQQEQKSFDCSAENLHLMTFSVLSGKSFSTSFFRRRSRKGRNTLCRRRMTRICSSSVSSILSWPPVLAKGVLNHSSNVLTDLKMFGRTKLSMAHSSDRLFWRGVPVRMSRKRVV